MNPKRVWGIVLIVLGVIAVLQGLNSYHGMKVADSGVRSMDAAISNFESTFGVKIPDNTHYEALSRREKWLSLMTVLLGISLSIIGTYMIKENQPTRSIDLWEDVDTDDLDSRPFKL